MNEIAALNAFIKTLHDVRELKRALTVKLTKQGYRPSEVRQMLDTSASYVTKWNKVYREQGLAGLRLAYQGSPGYLPPAQRQAVQEWLHTQTHWEVAALRAHIADRYGVVYKSPQSYYDLLKAAGLSRKKIPETQPQKRPGTGGPETPSVGPASAGMGGGVADRTAPAVLPG